MASGCLTPQGSLLSAFFDFHITFPLLLYFSFWVILPSASLFQGLNPVIPTTAEEEVVGMQGEGLA